MLDDTVLAFRVFLLSVECGLEMDFFGVFFFPFIMRAFHCFGLHSQLCSWLLDFTWEYVLWLGWCILVWHVLIFRIVK